MLFRKDMEKRCAYCAHAGRIDDEQVACVKRGIVASGSHCAAFRYDPLKRVPPRPVQLNTGDLKQEDFEV